MSAVEAVLVVSCTECEAVVGRFYESSVGVRVTGEHCPHGGVLGGRPAAELFNAAWSKDRREFVAVCDRYDVVLVSRAEPVEDV